VSEPLKTRAGPLPAPVPRRIGSLRLVPFCVSCLLGFVALGANAAHASPASLYGLGARWSAMGGAGVATANDFAACFYNPAGLARARTGSVEVGLLLHAGWLSVPGGTRGVGGPADAVLGLSVPLPLKRWLARRIWFGLAFTTPPNRLARLTAPMPSDIFYPYYENRGDRLMILPGLAARVIDRPSWGRLTVGVAANVLANLSGVVVAEQGAARSIQARVSEKLSTLVRVNAGVDYAFGDWSVALAYRQAFAIRMTTTSANRVAGADLDLDIVADVLYDPHTFSLGLSWSPTKWLLALQLDYALWRLYKGPFVGVSSVLPLVGALQGDPPEIQFHDAVALRLGMERRMVVGRKGVELSVRAGLAFETTPVPVQHGRTNMLDGDKVSAMLGLGVNLGRVFRRKVWIDLHGRLDALIPRTMAKRIDTPSQQCPAPPVGSVDPDDVLVDEQPCDRTDPGTLGFQTSNPGYPSVHSQGFVLSGSLMFGMEL